VPSGVAGRMSVDVAVVGAGISGLVAARQLVRGGVTDAMVVEARDRVGGKTLNHDLGGGKVVEGGGQWVGPAHHRLLALAGELGVQTYHQYDQGRNVVFRRGRRRTYRGSVPFAADPLGMLDFIQSALRLDRMSKRLRARSPWAGSEAAKLDIVSFESWLRRNAPTSGARWLWQLFSAVTMGGPPREISLLAVLHHLRGAGGVDQLLETDGGAQERRFVGGSHEISLRSARELGDRVLVSTPVRAIERAPGAPVELRCDEVTIEAGHAIVAMSPSDAARIAFSPPLPAVQAGMLDRVSMAKGVKVQAVYEEPFWRAEGLSGQAISDRGPVPLTFDNSPPDGSPGVLVGFGGSVANHPLALSGAALDDPAERERVTLECFARYFGGRARRPVDFLEKDWGSDEWATGCIPCWGPGSLTGYGAALGAPAGPIHFAGSETSEEWDGYMEGAVRAGERAASEVLARYERSLTPSASASRTAGAHSRIVSSRTE
jgi:monoamine oxidase